ncbi:MAG: class I SAM-dependent methyltransferase [Candidatus Bathyarchaeia archaeon]
MDPDFLRRAKRSNEERWAWIASRVEGRVLDLGGSSGEVWRRHPYHGEVLVLDLACYDDCPVPSLHGDAYHLPFKDGVFDTVVCSEVLEHLRGEPGPVIDEILRVCRGKLVLTVPDEEYWDKGAQPFRTREERIRDQEYERYIKPIQTLRIDIDEYRFPHHWHRLYFTAESLRKLLVEHGLTITFWQHVVWPPFAHWLVEAKRAGSLEAHRSSQSSSSNWYGGIGGWHGTFQA